MSQTKGVKTSEDVYSFGITMICIVTDNVLLGALPNISDTIVPFVHKLIVRCLSLAPKNHPSFAEILEIMNENNYYLFKDGKW